MRLLVVKFNQLGDTITFLPTLAALAQAKKITEIHVLTNSLGKEIFAGIIPVAQYIICDKPNSLRQNPFALYKIIRRIKSIGFRYSLFSYDCPSIAYFICYLAGIPRKIGFETHGVKLRFFLNHRLPFSYFRNVVDSNLDLVRYLVQNPSLTVKRQPLKYGVEISDKIHNKLQELSIVSPFIAIHPFARGEHRQWPLDRYLKLARQLEMKLQIPIIFISEKASVFDFPTISELSIKELACLLSQADLFIGNNSGPLHLAAAMGTSTISITGATPPRWHICFEDTLHKTIVADNLDCIPCEMYTRQKTCLNQDLSIGCLKKISVSQVFDAVIDIRKRISCENINGT